MTNELLAIIELQKQEIERLKKEIEELKHEQEVSTKWEMIVRQKNNELVEENELLNSIIKEVREYVENAIETGNCTEDISYENGIKKEHNYYVNSKDLLEILDKVEESK